MGIADLKSYLVDKLRPSAGLAGKISIVAFVAAAIFALGTFIGGLVHPGREEFLRGLEIMTLDPYGMNASTLLNNTIPFPQIVFCPLWKEGKILSANCWKAKGQGFVDHGNQLVPQLYPSKNYPNNTCYYFNFNGKDMPDWTWTISCDINATDYNPQRNVSWDGRVRVYVEVPGDRDFEDCQNCIDGIDGTIAIQGYKTLAFWQANYFAYRFNNTVYDRVDYNTDSSRIPYGQETEANGIKFLGGFYTPSVWVYDRPDVLFSGAQSFRAEEFAFRSAFLAAVLLVSYFLFACLRGTFVLLFVGEQTAQ